MLFDRMNIYADLASNHHGDSSTFNKMCLEVRAAGAIPKIQLWSPETFPREWVKFLSPKDFVPSVFRPSDVDFIVPYEPLALKVASAESTYWQLIERCMQHPLPIIVSTGGMDEQELYDLTELLAPHPHGVCIMHCVSNYPTRKEDLNLSRLTSIVEYLEDDMELGFSSHYPYVNPKVIGICYAYGVTQWEVHVRWDLGDESKRTLDEQCALLPSEIKLMRGILEDLAVIDGSDEITGPDREFVVSHRQRWQATD